eukprot:2912816-Amphidinium_carterae.1
MEKSGSESLRNGRWVMSLWRKHCGLKLVHGQPLLTGLRCCSCKHVCEGGISVVLCHLLSGVGFGGTG